MFSDEKRQIVDVSDRVDPEIIMSKVRGSVEYTQRRAKKGAGQRMVDLEGRFDDSRIGTDRTGS
jgi:hypothetical protein